MPDCAAGIAGSRVVGVFPSWDPPRRAAAPVPRAGTGADGRPARGEILRTALWSARAWNPQAPHANTACDGRFGVGAWPQTLHVCDVCTGSTLTTCPALYASWRSRCPQPLAGRPRFRPTFCLHVAARHRHRALGRGRQALGVQVLHHHGVHRIRQPATGLVRGVVPPPAPLPMQLVQLSGNWRPAACTPWSPTTTRPSARPCKAGDPGGRNRAVGDGATGAGAAPVGRPVAAGLLRVGPPRRDPALSPPVPALVEHVMDRWNNLVRCVRDPSVPSSTNLPGAGLAASNPGRGWPAGLKTPQGAQAFLHLLAGHLGSRSANQDRGEGAVHVQLNRFQRK